MFIVVILNPPDEGWRSEESLGYDEGLAIQTRFFFARDSFRIRSKRLPQNDKNNAIYTHYSLMGVDSGQRRIKFKIASLTTKY